MKIGDEIMVHGFVDEIRQDTVIIRNSGGYFGTAASEVMPADEPLQVTGKLPASEDEPYEYEIKALHKGYVEPYVKIEDELQTEREGE